jgi:glycosyltransferase involved in cell wall biosynthesis
MSQIRICFVSLYAYHLFNPENKSKFGGAELQLYLLASELAKDPQYDISFVVGDFGQPEFEIRHGIKLYKFFNPTKGLKYFRALWAFVRLWKLIHRINPDIFVQRSAGLETAEVGFFCGIKHKHFVYMVAHDSDINKQRPYWHQGLFGIFKWSLFRLGLRSAEFIFTQHELQELELKKHFKVATMVRPSAHLIPLEIDMRKKRFVLWVARCEDWKNPEIYLDLAEKFPNQEFVMVMPESNDKEYYKIIKTRALGIKNIRLIDYVEFDKIDPYFAQALVFVNTSKTEGFPNTFIQAFKNKTPVLSYRVNPNNILNDEKMGACAEGDKIKFENELQSLLADTQKREKMGNNAYSYVLEHHSLLKIVEKDKLVFNGLLKK